MRECPLSAERLTAQASCFGREGQDDGVPKERWLELERIVVINLGMEDFSSLMRSCAETRALESPRRGQTSSLSSCDSLLKDALRL